MKLFLMVFHQKMIYHIFQELLGKPTSAARIIYPPFLVFAY